MSFLRSSSATLTAGAIAVGAACFGVPIQSVGSNTVIPSEVITTKRQTLIDAIWGQTTLPSVALSGGANYTGSFYNDVGAASRLSFTYSMELGFNSVAYFLDAPTGNGKAVIYHHGHEPSPDSQADTVLARFLTDGYDVIVLSMPGFSPNTFPVGVVDHDAMEFLTPATGNPIKFFIEPVIAAVSYLSSQGYSAINMVGLSGGGWTTVLSSAVDTRIKNSFPVAGSLPIYLRNKSDINDYGDWEQNTPTIYGRVSYLEMYALGALGTGRSHTQINNLNDSSCFYGGRENSYENQLKVIAPSFDAVTDNNNTHTISATSLNLIMSRM